MAFQASAPPLPAYQALADCDEGKTQGKPSSSAQAPPTMIPHELHHAHLQASRVDPHHPPPSPPQHHHQHGRLVSNPRHHHDHDKLGYAANPLPQHHGGSIQYPPPGPPSDTSVVLGFPVQPPQLHPHWHTGLCGCCSDPVVCLLGCCCPCFLFGKIAEDLDDGATSCLAAATIWYVLQQFTSCGWLYSYGYRDKLRLRYGLTRRPGCDCIVHCCCWPCAFCQEYREIQIRRQKGEAVWGRNAVMAPPPQQVMRS